MKKLLALGVLLVALFVAPAQAKPVHAAASISLVEPLPVFLGQMIHFNHVNPSGLKDSPCQQGVYNCAWFQVACYQGANRVYYSGHAAIDTFTQFILGSPDMGNWQQVGGDAECQADLIDIQRGQHNWDPPIITVYASTFFHVDG